MKHIKIALVAIFSLVSTIIIAQNEFGGIISFDKTVHDFGDIKLSDGHVNCEFTYKNISSKPIVIHNIIASCGCTDPVWERKPLMPGKSAKLKVVFKNDQGPYPFSKNLTLYVSDVNKPVLLRIKGVVHKTKKSLDQLFPINIGGIGLREAVYDMNKIDQGAKRSETFELANLTSKPIKVGFTNNSEGLSMIVTPNPIPAKSKAKVQCTIATNESKNKNWGNTIYGANIVVNGVKQKGRIQVEAMIREGFNELTDEQRRKGALPQLNKTSVQLPDSKPGEKHTCKFTFKNDGKDDFIIYKVQSEDKGLSFKYTERTPYQKSGEITVDIDTTGKKGETLYVITIITNSPLRPIISLFITANIE